MGIFPVLHTVMPVKQDKIQNLKFDVSTHHVDVHVVVEEEGGVGAEKKKNYIL